MDVRNANTLSLIKDCLLILHAVVYNTVGWVGI